MMRSLVISSACLLAFVVGCGSSNPPPQPVEPGAPVTPLPVPPAPGPAAAAPPRTAPPPPKPAPVPEKP